MIKYKWRIHRASRIGAGSLWCVHIIPFSYESAGMRWFSQWDDAVRFAFTENPLHHLKPKARR